jgi:hypothetical protein
MFFRCRSWMASAMDTQVFTESSAPGGVSIAASSG